MTILRSKSLVHMFHLLLDTCTEEFSCSNYVRIDKPDRFLFLNAQLKWKISDEITTEQNEKDASCDIIKLKYAAHYPFEDQIDVELCNIYEGYEVGRFVGTESMIMEDYNCQKKLEELLRYSTPDEFVFMSKNKLNHQLVFQGKLFVLLQILVK